MNRICTCCCLTAVVAFTATAASVFETNLQRTDPETFMPIGMTCPYCSGSFDLPDGWWSGNWTRRAYTTITIVDKDGASVGTAIIDTGKIDSSGKVPVKVYVLKFLDQSQCIETDRPYPVDDSGNVVVRGGTLNLTITPNGEVNGTVDGYRVGGSVPQGGGDTFEHGTHSVKVTAGGYTLNPNYRLIGDALPAEVSVITRETGKWNCGKAATLKYKRSKATGEYVLTGLGDWTKPNTSRLTLKLNARKGTFTGSFKAYATNADNVAPGKKPKLKSYSFKVSGTLEGSVGIGTATCKALKAEWPVVIE